MNSFYIFNCFSDSVYFYGKICYISLNLDIFDDLYCLILFRILFIEFNELIIYLCILLLKNLELIYGVFFILIDCIK